MHLPLSQFNSLIRRMESAKEQANKAQADLKSICHTSKTISFVSEENSHSSHDCTRSLVRKKHTHLTECQMLSCVC